LEISDNEIRERDNILARGKKDKIKNVLGATEWLQLRHSKLRQQGEN